MTDATLARWRADAVLIFRAAVTAADPTRLVLEHLARDGSEVLVKGADGMTRRWRSPTLVVGAGKAAARMAAGCERVLGAENLRGEVVVADGCALDLQTITVTEAGHPLPDGRGAAAARRLIDLVKAPQADAILGLFSGGASSLLVCPRPPISLDDKVRTTRLLLDCGADINELNTVRKHLSLVKGGGLLRHAAAPVTTLIISDVVGDDPGTIASGPTSPDPTRFADAWAVLQRYHLTRRVPRTVARLLRDGVGGRLPETVKPDSPEAARCCNLVIGSNRTALHGAADMAREMGCRVHIETDPLVGDTADTARHFAARIRTLAGEHRARQPLCILAGGETTVRVHGRGRGGRNMEFALALADVIAGTQLAVLSAGTDGVDGPTTAAGAFVDGTTRERAAQRRLNPALALADNDSHTFFAQLGDLFECGPTGTNVMDIKIALAPAFSGSV